MTTSNSSSKLAQANWLPNESSSTKFSSTQFQLLMMKKSRGHIDLLAINGYIFPPS